MAKDPTPPAEPDPTAGAPPTAEGAEPELDDDDKRELAAEVTRAIARVVTSKDIRMMLVELTKRRVMEILDVSSDANLDNRSLLLPGTSPLQVLVVRRWLSEVVIPDVIAAYGTFLKDGTLPSRPSAEPPAAETTLSVAVDVEDTPPEPPQ